MCRAIVPFRAVACSCRCASAAGWPSRAMPRVDAACAPPRARRIASIASTTRRAPAVACASPARPAQSTPAARHGAATRPLDAPRARWPDRHRRRPASRRARRETRAPSRLPRHDAQRHRRHAQRAGLVQADAAGQHRSGRIGPAPGETLAARSSARRRPGQAGRRRIRAASRTSACGTASTNRLAPAAAANPARTPPPRLTTMRWAWSAGRGGDAPRPARGAKRICGIRARRSEARSSAQRAVSWRPGATLPSIARSDGTGARPRSWTLTARMPSAARRAHPGPRRARRRIVDDEHARVRAGSRSRGDLTARRRGRRARCAAARGVARRRAATAAAATPSARASEQRAQHVAEPHARPAGHAKQHVARRRSGPA